MSDAPGSKKTGGQSSNNPNQYEFDGQSYVYMDKTTNVKYKFDQVKNQWVPQDQSQNESGKDDEKKEEASGPAVAAPGGIYGFENDTHTYTDPNDGSVYIWDREKNAWFPKVIFFFLLYNIKSTSKLRHNVPNLIVRLMKTLWLDIK